VPCIATLYPRSVAHTPHLPPHMPGGTVGRIRTPCHALWNVETTFRPLAFVLRFAAPFLTNDVSTPVLCMYCCSCIAVHVLLCMYCCVCIALYVCILTCCSVCVYALFCASVLKASRQSACGIVGRHMGAVSAVDMCIGPLGSGLALTGGMDGVLQLHFLEEP
jgi:hypothetical protein